MANSTTNASPMVNALGINDVSTKPLLPTPLAIPTHLVKAYTYAQKGPALPQLVSGNSLQLMYGADSFDERKKWANHATVLLNSLQSTATTVMVQRIIPDDAGPEATIRLYLDVLPTQVVDYVRDQSGAITYDSQGNPVSTGTPIDGYKVQWIAVEVNLDTNGDTTFGSATNKPGSQSANSVQSIRYPIMDIKVSHIGSYGQNLGLRMWAPVSTHREPFSSKLLTDQKIYPFRMACVQRVDALSTPTFVTTRFGGQYTEVCFKPDTIQKDTDGLKYVGDVFTQSYNVFDNPSIAPQYGPFGEIVVYDENVSQLLNMFYAAEEPFINSLSDFKGDPDEEYRFNMLSGLSSTNIPYHSFQVLSSDANAVRMSESTSIFAKGGSDGTMNDTLFNTLVTRAVSDYADPNSFLQDTAKYPESIIYDTGFDLDTKYALVNFIALRKDTFITLTTYDSTGPILTASDESSLAVALRTRLQMFPESSYYGTPTVRGMVIGRSGKLLNSQYRKELPLIIEVATNASRYMGAGNGRWNSTYNFDTSPGNIVKMFTDINVTFTPASVRNTDWANGLNWVEAYDHRSFFFPALKTIYPDDTSVLTSFFTVMACVEMQKIGYRAHRKFCGGSKLRKSQLASNIKDWINKEIDGKFDDRFKIIPEVTFTAEDDQRGYSWTLTIKIGAPGMTSVENLTIETYRIEDLTSKTA